ncbi:hypothetical protein Ae201684P_020060 [Aphanomyces euteiches]|uniref:Uncharacterized protein n=1 Tax=Aphanomyces euteiches TaxID=100861 RepID=A0A6G0W543_9STRA|nr:hypothetical protein Ae201684_018653 [Aphanomyces euteiches]KAH9071801.1 hypothetical protein Ae201684P_020060 [Aphanomyces euteiches]
MSQLHVAVWKEGCQVDWKNKYSVHSGDDTVENGCQLWKPDKLSGVGGDKLPVVMVAARKSCTSRCKIEGNGRIQRKSRHSMEGFHGLEAVDQGQFRHTQYLEMQEARLDFQLSRRTSDETIKMEIIWLVLPSTVVMGQTTCGCNYSMKYGSYVKQTHSSVRFKCSRWR